MTPTKTLFVAAPATTSKKHTSEQQASKSSKPAGTEAAKPAAAEAAQ